MNVLDRFKSKVEVRRDGCWIWTGQKRGSHGHGGFYFAGKMRLAHRVAYELFVGELSDEQVVMHTCDVQGCVAPHHLVAGTQAQNIADMMAKGRGRGQFADGRRLRVA